MARRCSLGAITVLLVSMLGPFLVGCSDEPDATYLDHDFGTHSIDNGPVELQHSFRIENSGFRELEVVYVTATCGCVAASLEGSTIPPGGHIELPVRLQLSNAGQQSQNVYLKLYDGRHFSRRVFRLFASGRRGEALSVIPTRLLADAPQLVAQMTYVTYEPEGKERRWLAHAPAGIRVNETKRTVLEEVDPSQGRPLRILLHMSVDVADYTDGFPAIVELSMGSATSRLELAAPSERLSE